MSVPSDQPPADIFSQWRAVDGLINDTSATATFTQRITGGTYIYTRGDSEGTNAHTVIKRPREEKNRAIVRLLIEMIAVYDVYPKTVCAT